MCFVLSSASPATPRLVQRIFKLSAFSGLVLSLLLFLMAGTASAQSTPTNLTATASSGQVALSWTASTFPGAYPTYVNFYAAFYRVYRSTTPGGEAGNQIAEVDDPNADDDDTPAPSTTYTDTNVTPGVTYYYTITAVLETTRGGGEPGSGGLDGGPQVDTTESDMSNEASAALTGSAPPSAPSGLTATAGNGSTALSWTAPSGSGLTYNVKRATVSGGPYNTVGSSSGTSYPDTGLTNGTAYYYVVTAVNSAGESGNSNEATATPSGPLVDFSVAASPKNFGITPGGTASTLVTITPSSTFSGNVALSVSGLPAGVTAAFGPASPVAVAAGTPSSSTLTLTASGTVPSANFTVTATSGALTHTAALTLTAVGASAGGNNMTLTDLFLTGSSPTVRLRSQYNPSAPLVFSLTRNGTVILNQSMNGSTSVSCTTDGIGGVIFTDSDGIQFNTSTPGSATYSYSMQQASLHGVDSNGKPYTISGYTGSCTVVPMKSLAVDDQAVDSRLDPRYSTDTLVNHQFGSTTYRGGLFAGYNSDPARVGRSLIKFAIPAIPSGQHLWPVGSVSAYALRAYTPGTTTTVSCQRVSDTWTGPTVTWSLAPGMPAASNGMPVIDDGTDPINTWEHWLLTSDVYSAITSNNGLLSVELASTSETSPGWTYFAKKEYDLSLTPFVLYAYGATN